MAALDTLRQRLARWIAPPVERPAKAPTVRMYNSARISRLTSEWGVGVSDTSADAELHQSLRVLRNRARALVRDASFAKRARNIVVNNVIGQGVGFQAAVTNMRGRPVAAINADLEAAWDEWTRAENCHVAGVLPFAAIERLAMGQVFEAGEVLIRVRYTAPNGGIPLALEVMEAERLADTVEASAFNVGNQVRLGVEVDSDYRPIAYMVRQLHPGEVRSAGLMTDRVERVPADQVFHLKVVTRWPQTRGEPWLHTAVRKLHDADGYTEAEIIAARGGAAYMGTIETEDPDDPAVEETDAGDFEFELEPGLIKRLRPGDKFNLHAPNRPNNQADPFLRFLLREIAAGVGVSYEALSRDYSQSNYSSSRLALLDDRDTWRVLQNWYIQAFRAPLYRLWLNQAVLAGKLPRIPLAQYAADPARFQAARFKPRGWSWVDPTKEVAAYKEAVKAGFATVSDVIAATGDGRDLDEVLEARERELEAMADKGLVFDTNPESYANAAAANVPNAPPAQTPEDDQEDDQAEDETPPRQAAGGGRRNPLAYLLGRRR